jgi:hypothetical protein
MVGDVVRRRVDVGMDPGADRLGPVVRHLHRPGDRTDRLDVLLGVAVQSVDKIMGIISF